MAATLFFTLHPLRSLRASMHAAKKTDLPVAETAPETPKERGTVAVAAVRLGSERVNVQSASAARGELTAPASEQALLAARLRVDV